MGLGFGVSFEPVLEPRLGHATGTCKTFTPAKEQMILHRCEEQFETTSAMGPWCDGTPYLSTSHVAKAMELPPIFVAASSDPCIGSILKNFLSPLGTDLVAEEEVPTLLLSLFARGIPSSEAFSLLLRDMV